MEIRYSTGNIGIDGCTDSYQHYFVYGTRSYLYVNDIPLLGGLSVYLSFGRINPIGFRSFFVGSLACNSANAILMASSISKSLLAIRSLEFKLVSDAHELNAICSKFLFQPSPIVTSFHIVILIIDGTHDIRSRKLINIISRSMNND